MKAKPIMVQGTMSGAGKSLLVAGLCRILSDMGYRVSPFKAQNMALNSFVTEDGLEMGRAQVLQAQAARVTPSVDMNPILLKPTTDVGSQVIVHGRPLADMGARDYFRIRHTLKKDIRESYERLAETSDIIVIEGAGSPVELNLKRDDICNMGMAKMVKSPVVLVGDIDPGGIFAQLVGTIMLLTDEERAMVKATVVNKFRGDVTLFDEGIKILEEKCGVPVAGVVPYLDVNLEDEDSLSDRLTSTQTHDEDSLDVAVIRLPKLSNFTDFIALDAAPCVHVRYVRRPTELKDPDLIILPGTKSTVSDLTWLKHTGLASLIQERSQTGTPVIGICGGYQMLGEAIVDEGGFEGRKGTYEGLGLLPVTTTFASEKMTRQTLARIGSLRGRFAPLSGVSVVGYEIHQGRTGVFGGDPVLDRGDGTKDGCCQGSVLGCYLHGLFDGPEVVAALIGCIKPQAQTTQVLGMDELREAEIAKLASGISRALDMDLITKIIEEGL